MPVTAPNLLEYFFLLIFNVETVLSVCDVRVHTIDLGCHLEWNCSDANPKTTYTVQTKTRNKSWENVSDCIETSRQSCDLTRVFSNIYAYNFIRLGSEELPGMSETRICDPLNDSAATFSPPNIIISVDNESLWVTVNFPCAPSVYCDYDMTCNCTINYFISLSATVTLYNKQNLAERQTRNATVMEETTLKVEFGFLIPGQVYCAVANFTAEGVLDSSPMSLPQCVHIPAKIEIPIIVIMCAVPIALGLVIFLLWRNCATSERPLPRSLALLQDLELQKDTFIDSCEAAPHNESSEGDHISVVSICDITLTDNQHSYYNSQIMGNGYYTSPILHDPDCIEESVESLELGIEVQNNEFHLFPSHPALEAKVGCYQNQCEENPNIPLSSVQVKRTQQDEMSTEDSEWYGDVEMFKTDYETNENGPEQIQATDVSSQKAEYI
ncbi:hypothetical protein ABG768_024843 [Culter alburnus]|uniref:Fibronectin type-III domain-containing protein n=1 Tax=Culter alburnus TaxID=194366 RepID=A0AAW2AEJ9_CULAL